MEMLTVEGLKTIHTLAFGLRASNGSSLQRGMSTYFSHNLLYFLS